MMSIKVKNLAIMTLRFGISGISGFILDLATTSFLKEILGINSYLASGIGMMLAVILIFILHKKWTYSFSSKKVTTQFTRFLIVTVLGLFIQSATLVITHEKMEIPFYLAKIIAVIVTGFWNFSMNSIYAFSSKNNQMHYERIL